MDEPAAPAPWLRPGGETVLEIRDLAFGGRGVARHAGLVIFVLGALPGETVRARILQVRRAYAEAAAVQILQASPDRVDPPCRHYGSCGGCDLQHLGAPAQARAKGTQVRELLVRLAGLADPQVAETISPGDPWGYRFRMDFEWTLDGPGKPRLGLHRRASATEIVPIDRCHLASETVNRLAAWLAAEAGARHLVPWDAGRRRGILRRASFQEARGTGEILVSLTTGLGDPPALASLAGDLMRRFPRVVGVAREAIDRQGRRREESILAGRDVLNEEVEGDRFEIPAGAFFQPNATACAALRREVLAALQPRGDEAILELYCGVGFFTVALGRRVREVVAVEGSRAACAAARSNAARAGLSNCRFVQAEVGAVVPGLDGRSSWDGIILDPPRAGLPRGAAAALAAAPSRRLVYVSCDPATLARDLRILAGEGRFRVSRVVPLDLFPQTRHIECVALMERP